MSTLVIFFSQSGNTRKLANMIGADLGADIAEINDAGSYTADLSKYDTVFVGSPNWAATAAGPVKTFLSSADLSGKKVAMFCTHGMGGMQNVADDMIKLCPSSQIIGRFAYKGVDIDSAGDKVKDWLKEIGVL
ncbi:MAG: hypothetical protein J5827_01530 [Oscillospiraceae bacterium]|nr:hypothetical protein [Oscillospiraceae bacterium]